MSIANKKVFIPRPPDKGSFPLDHDGECRDHMIKYLECLQANDRDHSPCRVLTQTYLKCRMDTDLMAKEEWEKLGFHPNKPS